MNRPSPGPRDRGAAAFVLALALIATARFVRAADYRVASASELPPLSAQLRPGDAVVLADGQWSDQTLVLHGRGSPTQPIVFRAQTPGKVVLTGRSSIEITGEHVVVSGLFLQDSSATGDGMKLTGRHCRLTESAVIGGRHKFFVRFFGLSNRLDHCYLAGKTNDSPTLQVEVEGRPNGHVIDQNHFGPRPPLGRNGGETIRVGYSHQSMTNSGTIVEGNLFDRCDGELEIVSNKSCENIYRFNTFLECAGMFTLRHGNRCLVEGNFFLGRGRRGSGGIRVIGEGHRIFNNYIDGVRQGGFWITAGIPDSPLVGYFQSRDCVIAFNTVVDSSGPCVQLDAGLGTAGRTLRPEKITLANNLFAPAAGSAAFKGTEGRGFRWLGNVATAGAAGDRAGVRVADTGLVRAPDGLWRPATNSPVRGSAEGDFTEVRMDMDGQPRDGRLDVGSDQVSDAPRKSRPLTAADVGPSWLVPREE